MASSDRKPAAVVIGLDSITGLQTARLLARRDIPVVGIARAARHPSCRTNVCERIVIGSTAGEALADVLGRLAPTFASPPVLFPCTDLSVLAVSRYREQLADRFRFVLPRPGVIERLLDKASFQSFAVEEGLPVAGTAVLRCREEAERAAGVLRFPCVLKPAVKTERWQATTTAKVFRAANPRELLLHYDRCRDWVDALIVQEWIDGPDTAHVTCNAYFDASSRPHVTFVSRKLRQWPLEGGVGCLSEEYRDDTVRDETVRLFHRAGHRGLAYLEMKLDTRDGRYAIIEPNVGRPTGRSAAADIAGIDLLYAHYCDALGWPLPPAREQTFGTTKWIYLRQDLQSAAAQWRRGTLTIGDWARSLQGFRRDAVFSWRDPAPFFADLLVGLRKAARGDARPAETAAAAARSAEPAARPHVRVEDDTDFDLQGSVGVRVVGATAKDLAAVVRQIGPSGSRLEREPDIVLRFVDDLPIERLHWVEYGRTGFTDDGFYFLQSGKHPARVRIPMDQVGGRCEIVCQRGLRSVPLLMAVITLTALGRGCVPLHASAFEYGGRGILVTGWAKGGKTESLLAFAAEGAEYIGDEWILLTPDGRMVGIPEVMRVQDWHLSQLPHLRERVPVSRRSFFKGVRAAERAYRSMPDGPLGRLLPRRTLAEALPALRRQLNFQVNPLEVFRPRQRRASVPLDTVFFMVSWDDPAIEVEPADPAGIARRMASSVTYEQSPLLAAYLAFRFAFPERRNDLLERASALQAELIERVLAGRDAYIVRHPYPCLLRGLYEAMAPVCLNGSTRASRRDSEKPRPAVPAASASHG